MRLRHVASVNPATPEFDGLSEAASVPFLPLEAVWPGDRLDTSRRRLKSEVSSGYTRFLEGDILVPKITPTFQANRTVVARGIEGGIGAATTELHVVRVGPTAENRYLRYLLTSKSFLDEGEASMIGVAGQKRVPDDCIRDLAVPVVELRIQRAIADYLDAETARIDALITKKWQVVDLLEEKQSQLFAAAMTDLGFWFPPTLDSIHDPMLLPTGWRAMHLSQVLVQLTNGYVGPTRDILRDEGIRYVQSLHIKAGKIDFARRPFYVSEEWHNERPRIHLRAGDVLIVQTGDIGQVAVVTEEFGEASCHALQIARVRGDIVSGAYLGEYLRSPFGYQSLLSRATGALHPHLEGGIRDVPVVVPPHATQSLLVTQLATERAKLEALVGRIERQIDLLIEHRQAMITAAITGELDIPGLAA
jgi:type I restriction enzyme S subunit